MYKLSPQWWSGRSTTGHIVLDLRSPVWGFGETEWYCSLHHFTASQCVFTCALLTFSSSPTIWLQFETGAFLPPPSPGLGLGERGVGDRPNWQFAQGVPISSYWHTLSISYRFELVGWFQKCFRPFDPDTMTITFIEALPISDSTCNFQLLVMAVLFASVFSLSYRTDLIHRLRYINIGIVWSEKLCTAQLRFLNSYCSK